MNCGPSTRKNFWDGSAYTNGFVPSFTTHWGSEEEEGEGMERMTQQIEGIRYKLMKSCIWLWRALRGAIRDSHVAQLKFWLCHGLAVWSWSSSYTSLSLFPFLSSTDICHGSTIRTPAVRVMDKQVGNRKAESGGGYKLPKSDVLWSLIVALWIFSLYLPKLQLTSVVSGHRSVSGPTDLITEQCVQCTKNRPFAYELHWSTLRAVPSSHSGEDPPTPS